MDLLLYLFIIIIVLLLYMRFEAGFLKIEHVNLSGNDNRLKIVFLSDIHIERFFIPQNKLFRILREINPYLIVLGGDYLDYSKSSDKALKLLEGIAKITTTIAVLGNHDYKAFKHDLDKQKVFISNIRKTGIKLLINETVSITHNNKEYKFIGLDDINMNEINYDSFFEKNSFETNIIICHNPDIIYEIPKNTADYLLAGHIHGGQIRTPFKIEFKLLRNDKIYKENIISGHHKMNGIDLYISRGIGNTLLPLRFFSRPELTIIEI